MTPDRSFTSGFVLSSDLKRLVAEHGVLKSVQSGPCPNVRRALRTPIRWASGCDMMERIYFGLEIVGGRGVRPADIASLPFADFWSESSIRSALTKDAATDEWPVRLSDWEEFSKLFIETGRHRNLTSPPQVL